jgi:hypothetical protein
MGRGGMRTCPPRRCPHRTVPTRFVLLLLLLLNGVTAGADSDQQAESLESGEVAAAGGEQLTVLEQLERAGSDVKAIGAIIKSAKEAGLPEEEMEVARRAAQRAILGDYSKNTKSVEVAVHELKQTLQEPGATAADKRRALEEAERKGANSQKHYLWEEYVRQVQVAEQAERDEAVAREEEALEAKRLELEAMGGFSLVGWLAALVAELGVDPEDVLLAIVTAALLAACVAVWRACNKPSAARLQQELLADEARELAKKGKRVNSKAAAVRLTNET